MRTFALAGPGNPAASHPYSHDRTCRSRTATTEPIRDNERYPQNRSHIDTAAGLAALPLGTPGPKVSRTIEFELEFKCGSVKLCRVFCVDGVAGPHTENGHQSAW